MKNLPTSPDLSPYLNLIFNVILCNNCLGRQFGNLLSGLSNYDRGYSIKTFFGLTGEFLIKNNQIKEGKDLLKHLSESNFTPAKIALRKMAIDTPDTNVKCELCSNLFTENQFQILEQNVRKAVEEYEFHTFLVGSVFPSSTLENEDEIRAKFALNFGESIKSEFNREFGKYLSKSLLKDFEVELRTPDIVILVDISKKQIKIHSNPLFIYGRYLKLKRGISQSIWHCSHCRGSGCKECGFSGKKHPYSVEEFILEPLKKACQSTEGKFHGSGREDVDARMLGRGRPFVAELTSPKKRYHDLKELMTKINENSTFLIEVQVLELGSRTIVRKLKSMSRQMKKSYYLIVEVNQDIVVSTNKIKEIEDFFKNKIIDQRTPLRVLHRRADKIRKREVHELKIKELGLRRIGITVRCEGGLYVKELISGDEGRTSPNIAQMLKIEAVVTALDVLDVEKAN